MLDKSIPYKNIFMKISAEDIKKIEVSKLPKDYTYRMFQEGDEHHWARIEASVDEFPNEQEALEYFTGAYLHDLEKLKERCVFVVNPEGLPIATATAWFADSEELSYQATLQWVSTVPEYQGKGLGKAVVTKAMSIFPVTDPGLPSMLHTQTWSHVAVVLYHKLGFYITQEERVALLLMEKGSIVTKIFQNDYYNGSIDILKKVIDAKLFDEIVANAR